MEARRDNGTPPFPLEEVVNGLTAKACETRVLPPAPVDSREGGEVGKGPSAEGRIVEVTRLGCNTNSFPAGGGGCTDGGMGGRPPKVTMEVSG